MNFGRLSKVEFAGKLTAALGYVGLGKQDRVGLTTFSDRLQEFVPPRRGNQQLSQILQMLDGMSPQGSSDFEQAFKAYVARASTRGLAVVLSDCFSQRDYQNAFRCLTYGGFEVVVIRILADEELSPDMPVRITGRVQTLRRMGKAGFAHLLQGGEREGQPRYSPPATGRSRDSCPTEPAEAFVPPRMDALDGNRR